MRYSCEQCGSGIEVPRPTAKVPADHNPMTPFILGSSASSICDECKIANKYGSGEPGSLFDGQEDD